MVSNNLSEILIEIEIFSLKKNAFEMAATFGEPRYHELHLSGPFTGSPWVLLSQYLAEMDISLSRSL